jgi:hypothetical protein
MQQGYCDSCRRMTGFKRSLGWGTFFGSIITFGILILFIPFYPKRCVVCGNLIGNSEDSNDKHKDKLSEIGGIPSEQIRYERKCPYCAELILREAIVCKHCSRDVEPISTINIPRDNNEIEPIAYINIPRDNNEVEPIAITSIPNTNDEDINIARFIKENNPEENYHLAIYHLRRNEIRSSIACLEAAINKSSPSSKIHINASKVLNDVNRNIKLCDIELSK